MAAAKDRVIKELDALQRKIDKLRGFLQKRRGIAYRHPPDWEQRA
jgi:hypothetical protein